MRKSIAVIELYGGRIGLTLKNKSQVLREVGTDNLKDYRQATDEDVAWVRAMSGYVPAEGHKKEGGA